jgi:SAM-dependent methyltransferase
MIDRIKERLLSFPAAYAWLQKLLAKPGIDIIGDCLEIQSGCKILDIGCGPARILERLPDSVEYVGFDPSEKYIEAARSRYGRSPLRSFHVQGIDEADLGGNTGYFDVVLAIGVLHQLDDDQAAKVFRLAKLALTGGGVSLSGCRFFPRPASGRPMPGGHGSRKIRPNPGRI